jgi:IS30 family transposase
MRRLGVSLPRIANVLGRRAEVVHEVLRRTGGVAPRARRRCERHLQLSEREEISRLLAAGQSLTSIARALGRAVSTVSREVSRHGGAEAYRALGADKRALDNARRPKPRKLHAQPSLMELVCNKLKLDWSPVQIAAWLRREYPHDARMHVSHEAIYQALYVQARGELKKELIAHLRKHHAIRHPKSSKSASESAYVIPNMINISDRPADAADRAVPGHWEGDLLCGGNSSQIITLVERRSRYAILIKADRRDATTVADALIDHIKHRHQRPGLFLRSALTLAARHQREHQRPAATILSQGRRSLKGSSAAARLRQLAAEHEAAPNAGFPDARPDVNGGVALTD